MPPLDNMAEESTILPQAYCLWYHDPNNSSYSMKDYIKILDIKTVTDFWSIVDGVSLKAWNAGMFFLMREGYRPLWDAPENEHGGAWSKKVDASETNAVFVDCMVHCLANSILKTENDTVVGVTVSPKGAFHIIKIWNKTTAVSDRRLFSPTLKMKLGDDIAYRAHAVRPR